jgi:hypothetical protein
MKRSVAIELVAYGVLIPTTLASVPLALLAFLILPDALRTGNPLAAVATSILAALGWFGIITLWRLCFALKAGTEARLRPGLIWFGLLCGLSASVALSVLSLPSIGWAVAFTWPVVGAIVLGVMFRRARLRPNNSFKPKPLRGSA